MIELDEEIKVNMEKVKNIRRKVYFREARNIKSKSIKDKAMVKEIKKVIESEVNRCY